MILRGSYFKPSDIQQVQTVEGLDLLVILADISASQQWRIGISNIRRSMPLKRQICCLGMALWRTYL